VGLSNFIRQPVIDRLHSGVILSEEKERACRNEEEEDEKDFTDEHIVEQLQELDFELKKEELRQQKAKRRQYKY